MSVKQPESKSISNKELKQSIISRLRDVQISTNLPLKNCDPPALELDVYITEDKMEKLIVYKDDNPELVAEQF